MNKAALIVLLISYSLVIADESSWKDWKQIHKGNIVVFCRPGDQQFGMKVIEIIDDICPRISGQLGLMQCPEVSVYITSSPFEFKAITKGQVPDWGIAAADPSQSTIFLKSPKFSKTTSDLWEIVVHELSHVVLYHAVGGRNIPRWFDEGFAQSQAQESRFQGAVLLARYVVAGRLLQLKDIDHILTYKRDKAMLAYEMSLSVMHFLHKMSKPSGLVPMIQTIKKYGSMDQAIRIGTGFSMGEFEKRWRDYVKDHYFWYIFMDFPVLFGFIITILFLAAIVVRHQRNQERLRIWENEESVEVELEK